MQEIYVLFLLLLIWQPEDDTLMNFAFTLQIHLVFFFCCSSLLVYPLFIMVILNKLVTFLFGDKAYL